MIILLDLEQEKGDPEAATMSGLHVLSPGREEQSLKKGEMLSLGSPLKNLDRAAPEALRYGPSFSVTWADTIALLLFKLI